MQTVNFNCPHCGNLMAVGTNLLGRNVRCPHCKQVVRAPVGAGEGPPAPAAPPPTFNVPGPTGEHHESIFGERHDEDLFGSEPLKPTLPSMPAPPPPPLEETVQVPSPAPPPPSETLTYEQPAPATMPTESFDVDEPPPPPPARTPDEHREPAGPRYRVQRPPVETAGTPAFAWILLVYSVLMTVAAGIFAYQYFMSGSSGGHPFQAIPDFYGKYEKATGAENRKQLSYTGLPDPKLDVPPPLRLKLGEEITVGDLQVRPTAVTQQRMSVFRQNATRDDDTRMAGNGMVLTLHVKNLSANTVFHPDDPAFNRAYQKDQPAPYTALQVGRRFFYGPFEWPLPADIKDAHVVGFQNPEEPLGPGEERDISILVAPDGLRTAGANSAVGERKLSQPGTPFLWRVQLRRGLVKATTPEGKEVDVSATTVIGVEFGPEQIRDR